MPTVLFPAMRSMRMLSAFRARQRSSQRLVMRLYLMPASGLNSKVVTTGPGLICVIWPWISNSAYFSVSTCARSLSSSASTCCCSSGRCSRLLEGNLYPPAMRGMVVLALWPLSARSVTSGSASASSVAFMAPGSGRIPPIGCADFGASSSIMRSMPVRRASATAGAWAEDAGRDCINCDFVTGLEMRRWSSSFC